MEAADCTIKIRTCWWRRLDHCLGMHRRSLSDNPRSSVCETCSGKTVVEFPNCRACRHELRIEWAGASRKGPAGSEKVEIWSSSNSWRRPTKIARNAIIVGIGFPVLGEVIVFGTNAVRPNPPEQVLALLALAVAAIGLFIQPAVQVSADRPPAQYEIGRLLWWKGPQVSGKVSARSPQMQIGRLLWWKGPQVSGKVSARSPQMQTEEWESWIAELLPLLVKADLMLFDDAVALLRAVRAHKVCPETLRTGLRILNARYFGGIAPENCATGPSSAGTGCK